MTQLITDEYRKQNAALHAEGNYGISGARYREQVRPLADWGRHEILDYGCGSCTLAHALGPAYTVHNYDPALPEHSDPPEPCDVVTCTDVLEHIEPDLMDNVIADIRRLTKDKAFIAIALAKSSRTLDDGRNAHLSLHTVEEWRTMLEKHGFRIIDEKPTHRTVNLWWCILE